MSGSTFYIFIYDPTTDTFTKKTKVLSGVVGRMCVVDGRQGEVWLARGSSGITHLTGCDTGSPTAKNITMSSCSCIGAGRGKTADDYPSLYIWGRKTTSQPLGLYRSDDQGTTWTRINDDQNQFGGPGNAQIVCGDINVYGRVYMSTVGRGVICGTFISDEDTNINTLSAPQTSSLFREGIYDLQGRRYAERPSVQGLYIRNGKKILIE